MSCSEGFPLKILVHLSERELACVDQFLVGYDAVRGGLRADAKILQPHAGYLFAVAVNEPFG